MFQSPAVSYASSTISKLALATTAIGAAMAASNFNRKLGTIIAAGSLAVAVIAYLASACTKPKPKQASTNLFDTSDTSLTGELSK